MLWCSRTSVVQSVHSGTLHVTRMSVNSAGTMEELANPAGAGTVVKEYLQCRGILSVGTLSMLAKHDDAFSATIIDPPLAGL